MNSSTVEVSDKFFDLVNKIPQIGVKSHAENLIKAARRNLSSVTKTIKDLSSLKGAKAASGIVISAGPSVYRQNSIKRILESGYQGVVIATDGSYIACLKAGLFPDFVITLDPHLKRIVRWFGDPDFEKNAENDDYFV